MADRVCFLNGLTDHSEITMGHVFLTILKRSEAEKTFVIKKAISFDIKSIRRNHLDHILCQPYNAKKDGDLQQFIDWSKTPLHTFTFALLQRK